MLNQKTICVVMPAYNASETLATTYQEIPLDVVDHVVLVDDKSQDNTPELAKNLNIDTIVHDNNLGYGGNQKTCYRTALAYNSDIIIMLHPDYQYTPQLLVAIAAMIAYGQYDAVIASRVLAQNPIKRGMPIYKYISNRILTLFQNIVMQQKLSEYHSGYRAFSSSVLENLPLGENSNDFVFDNEMLAQIIYFDFKLGEISCPTRYTAESSSISFVRSVKYGLGVMAVSIKYFLNKRGLRQFNIFNPEGRKI